MLNNYIYCPKCRCILGLSILQDDGELTEFCPKCYNVVSLSQREIQLLDTGITLESKNIKYLQYQ